MTYCHVSRQCDDYAHHVGMLEAKEESLALKVTDRIEELTSKGGDYYPFSRERIFEALGQLTDSQEIIFQYAIENSVTNIGVILRQWIENYWTIAAENQAIRELK